MNTPFRYDFVGMFFTPQKLKDARKNSKKDNLTGKLTAVEDECILELVAKIKELGISCDHGRKNQKIDMASWISWLGIEGIEHQEDSSRGSTTLTRSCND